MPMAARIVIVLVLGLPLLAGPGGAWAQGTAPAQGVTQPMPQPAPASGPPAPKPGELSDGRPKRDAGGGAASTAPETTGNLPLPLPGQADPVEKR
jgi:hypothetical protein